jgi:4-amino-4-deoxy-L-arabinose transferase-like glycosyltransferase
MHAELTMKNETNPAVGTGDGPRLIDAIVLALMIGLFFSLFLGSRPLSVPDEGRYVEIPREMVVTGDWLTPRLNGVKYFEKPPLFYWFEAGLIKLFGLSEWSVRIGPALFAVFGCLAVYFAGSRMFGRRAGLASAIVLATNILYYALSQLITLDMPVSVLLTASLLAFLLGTRETETSSRRIFFWAFYVFAALAVLAKGLIGIVIPGMIIGSWILLMNEWRVLRSMHLASGMAIFLLIAVPWHILVDRANPEFFNFYFIHEHFQRYLTKVHGRYKPFWFFIPIVLLGLFPWIAFLFQAVKQNFPTSWKDRARHKEAIFLMLWAGLVFLFFSASSSKLVTYILPVFPPLAILIGRFLADAWGRRQLGGIRAAEVLLLLTAMVFVIAIGLLPRYRPEFDIHVLRPHLYAIIIVLFAGNLATWILNRKYGVRSGLLALTVTTMIFAIACSSTMPHLDTRSIKQLAMDLRSHLRSSDEVVSYRTYYQDLPVYLERRITVVEWKGELEFGTTVEDTKGWMINEIELWKRWLGPRRMFLVAGKKDADALRRTPERPFFLITENKNTVILSNIEDKP